MVIRADSRVPLSRSLPSPVCYHSHHSHCPTLALLIYFHNLCSLKLGRQTVFIPQQLCAEEVAKARQARAPTGSDGGDHRGGTGSQQGSFFLCCVWKLSKTLLDFSLMLSMAPSPLRSGPSQHHALHPQNRVPHKMKVLRCSSWDSEGQEVGRQHEPFRCGCLCSLWTFPTHLPPPAHRAKPPPLGAVREHGENSSSACLEEALPLHARYLVQGRARLSCLPHIAGCLPPRRRAGLHLCG